MNKSLSIVFVATMFLAGCGKSEENSTTQAAPSTGPKLTVGVVFDSGGVGDKSFNDSAKAGLDKAEKDLGITPKTVSSASEKDYGTNLEAMAGGGCDLVFAVGISQSNALTEVAKKHPNVKFAIVDGTVPGVANVRNLHFNEEQGSFLAGYLAALTTKTEEARVRWRARARLDQEILCWLRCRREDCRSHGRSVAGQVHRKLGQPGLRKSGGAAALRHRRGYRLPRRRPRRTWV